MESVTELSSQLAPGNLKSDKGLFALDSNKRSISLLTLALTILFVGLRLLTSDASDPLFNSASLPIVGLFLIVLLVYSNPTWGFILVLYDMCLLAEQVGVESWQFFNIFRFRDMEFLALMAIGIQMGALSFRGEYFARLTKAIKIYLVLVGLMTIYSMFVYGLTEALQSSRMLFFISLVFVMPAFCKDQDDLKRLLKYVFFFVALSTLVDFAGFVVGNPSIMTPFNHNLDVAGSIWAELGGVTRAYGGIGYAGYAVPFNLLGIFCLAALMVVGRLRPLSWIVIGGLAISLELLSTSKSSLGGLVVGIGIIVVLGAKHGALKIAVPTIVLSSAVLLVLTLNTPSNADPSSGGYKERFTQLFEQVQGKQEGTFTARLAYFETAAHGMNSRGGNLVTGMGYQLLPTEYGVLFDIAPFNNQTFQKSKQLIGTTSLDSGWGNVFWTMGLVGVGFFLWMTVYYLRVSFAIFRTADDVIPRALALCLLTFFAVFPILFFGRTLIYGKQELFIIFQLVLLIGMLGLWIDYSPPNSTYRSWPIRVEPRQLWRARATPSNNSCKRDFRHVN